MNHANPSQRCLLIAVVFWASFLTGAQAQREPHIGYIYPAGGRQGTTFVAVIGGQYLNNATNLFVSGTGIHVAILEQERQLTPKEQQTLKEKLSKLQEKRKQGERLTPEEMKTAEEIRKRLTAFGRRLANPALGEFVTLQVTVATNAVLGQRELRLATQTGLSNPRNFYVGQLPEYSKPDWKNTPKTKFKMEPKLDPTPPPVTITLPATVNGQIPPGGVDRYRFHATAGQQLVVTVNARELIPYLADAVPGWFQAAVSLADAQGKELAYDDDYQFHPDPVLFYKIPKDGDYVLAIKDSLYRGREDFVYRITMGELPFITGIFPLGGTCGTATTVALAGWNLPQTKVPIECNAPGIYPVEIRNAGRLSNRVPFAADTLPECFEQEPNNTATNAQPAARPMIINGRIDQPGDWDVFRIDGKAGDQIVAEVYARRLDSPLDSVLKLTDATGQQLAFNDDHEDKASGLNTHHADSYLTTKLPATGTYYLYLGDTQNNGGPAYSYRLRLSAPRPDFELRVAPSSLSVRGGTSVPLTVFALRRDGFAGEIALRLTDGPAGFKLTATPVPANQDQVQLTLSAPPTTTPVPIRLHIEGRAVIQGREIVHPAVPADDMMQAFAYRHLVPAQDLAVMVAGRFNPRDAARIVSATPVKIPAGGTSRVEVSLPVGLFINKIQFELSEPPDGITIRESSAQAILLEADATKVKPGLKGNLIVKASGERAQGAGSPKPTAKKPRIPLGALPAIPFEVVSQ